MRADAPDTLRALAREHLEGRSSLERYRRLRAELLDGLLACGAGPASDITQPREPGGREAMSLPPAANLLEPTARPVTPAPRAAAQRLKSARPAAKGSGGRAAAFAAVGLILAVGVVLLVRQQRSRAVAPHPAADMTNSAASADPIHTLLLPLLNDGDWSDSSLRALDDALRKYPPARIAADRDTGWFNTAVEIVRFRVKQQQALASAPLTPATSPIAALAQTLGVDRPSSEPASATRDDD